MEFSSQKGIFPGEFDVLIGAIALTHKMVVVTNNENHYEGMKRHFSLDVQNWMKKPKNYYPLQSRRG